MTYDPENANRDRERRTPSVDYRRTNWVAWIAAAGLIAIGAFALIQSPNAPGTDPQTTGSTSNSEPAPAPTVPPAPADNNAAPAPVTPPAGTTQQ
ncbi:hypothetical protein CWR43_09465 [Rhizobium sullae]|uniref:Uncharacterized protein n=1 Tax=Rhizobium sullae TaxID=50338 RepID=A0A2N0DCL6_RHISU|nr:hypothetical protein [Rhizobium sullae]PKA43839.1 hypothetical protein CWR43_09465 [Rhizobium sullae]